ncbi:uncharacterized protein LOC141714880 [Apium graveolens]|uniref:uncharacterized protein LOC141714880 n=1 Tax=Apium graveolens TaxID=4045 RepID=UPI003D79334C
MEQNRDLLIDVTSQEVKEAVFHMHPDKAPGPDGMTPAFFQKNWSVVGVEMTQMVRNFFQTGNLIDNINSTNIVLIPKKKNPTVLTELRPIALCNVAMKIITKVIANRMKKVLDSVISETQSAFLPGRLITDNIMISFEIMHYLKRKKLGKEGSMAIKLDMSKAYDRIEWRFLKEVLDRMGFDVWWIHLILKCVTTVDYTIVHGDSEMGPIKPSRGLRQGDPLSPYLFIICAEGLSAMIQNYVTRQWLQGIKICRKAPSISHMLFADDSYLYCKADVEEAGRVLELLSVYEKASGQRINRSKSTVFFSANIIPYNKERICQLFQIPEADQSTKYLGLPNIIGRNKSAIFGYLRDRVNATIHNWNERNISRSAKEILIRTVAQTLPSYAMNVFLLPLNLVQDMEKAMAKFYWSSSKQSGSRSTWMSWERMARHKKVGGLGFKRLRDVNMSLLGKQCWRFITHPESLVARLYKARYYADSDFLNSKLGSNPSFTWRSISESKEVISAGSCWRIGTGTEIDILKQPWLNDVENPYISTVSPALNDQKVVALFSTDTKEWDMDLVADIFNTRDFNCIMNTKVERDLDRDTLCWKFENTGQYTVKSAYNFIQRRNGLWCTNPSDEFWNKLWKVEAPPRALNLVWRAVVNCLPTKTILQARQVRIDNLCPVCQEDAESVLHCLVQCRYAAFCWRIFKPDLCITEYRDFVDWLDQMLRNQPVNTSGKIITLCWSIWRARNDLIWNQRSWNSMRIVAKAWEYLSQWKSAQGRYQSAPLQPPVQGDGAVYWVKPQHEVVKITVDAAIMEHQGVSGIGLIARDHAGNLILARTRCIVEIMNPTLAEAIAVKEALSWAKELPGANFVIESDCLVVVQLIRSATPMRSRIGQIIEECRRSLQELNNVKLYFVKRSANMSAHELAHVAHIYPDRIFEWSSVPDKVKVYFFCCLVGTLVPIEASFTAFLALLSVFRFAMDEDDSSNGTINSFDDGYGYNQYSNTFDQEWVDQPGFSYMDNGVKNFPYQQQYYDQQYEPLQQYQYSLSEEPQFSLTDVVVEAERTNKMLKKLMHEINELKTQNLSMEAQITELDEHATDVKINDVVVEDNVNEDDKIKESNTKMVVVSLPQLVPKLPFLNQDITYVDQRLGIGKFVFILASTYKSPILQDTFYNVDVITPLVQDSSQILIGDPFETALKFQAEEEGEDRVISLIVIVINQDVRLAHEKVRSEDKPPPKPPPRMNVKGVFYYYGVEFFHCFITKFSKSTHASAQLFLTDAIFYFSNASLEVFCRIKTTLKDTLDSFCGGMFMVEKVDLLPSL